MKAVVNEVYGPPDVLEIKDVPVPVPEDSEILIEVHAASVNAWDWHWLKADPFVMRFMGGGILKPKNQILGIDVAGRIEAVGRSVKELKPGDEVFGDLSGSGAGGFAEYVCAPEAALALKPAAVTFEQAAAAPMAGVTALQGLRDHGRIRQGQKVLVNGASGGVGTFAVQIGRSFGAEVTAVCSTRNQEMAHSIGADHVIDYTAEDFTRSAKRYDLIFAANGYHPILHYRRALAPGGTYIMAGGTMAQIAEANFLGPIMSLFGSRRMRGFVARPDRDDLAFLAELMEVGKVVPFIDRRYALGGVAEAIRYLDGGHARGKVVINVKQDS